MHKITKFDKPTESKLMSNNNNKTIISNIHEKYLKAQSSNKIKLKLRRWLLQDKKLNKNIYISISHKSIKNNHLILDLLALFKL